MAMLSDKFNLSSFPMEKITEVIFEKVRLHQNQVIAYEPLVSSQTTFSVRDDTLANLIIHGQRLILTMETELAAGRIQDKQIKKIYYHTFIWQMFKEKYLPKWFTKKFLVKKQEEIVEVITNNYFVCPHLAIDPKETHVRYMMVGNQVKQR
jgi:hypothetical protein